MKNLTAILLLLAIALTVAVDADKSKGGFNLSGSFDPDFSFGRGGRNRKHRSSPKEEDSENDDSSDWPSLEQVHHFSAPKEFTHGGSHDAEEENDPTPDNHKNHGKGHKHG